MGLSEPNHALQTALTCVWRKRLAGVSLGRLTRLLPRPSILSDSDLNEPRSSQWLSGSSGSTASLEKESARNPSNHLRDGRAKQTGIANTFKNMNFPGDIIYTLGHFFFSFCGSPGGFNPLTISHTQKDKGAHGGKKTRLHESNPTQLLNHSGFKFVF